MSVSASFGKKHYNSQRCRSLEGALAQRIGEQFPRIGGPRIQRLCAEMILEVVFEHMRPSESVRHGQILWSAISLDDPPSPMRPTSSATLVPVLLSLCTPDDVEDRVNGRSLGEQLGPRCARLCVEAHKQGGLLSNCDIALMLGVNDSRVATALSGYEKATGKLVPRRATLHDVGTCLTHKRLICIQRWVHGKPSGDIARDTCHSIEAVDRYLGMFERVRCCRKNAMDAEQTAFALGCTVRLVQEYLEIDDLLERKEDANDNDVPS